MTVWLIRAGKAGERDRWCLENGYAGGGWHEVADLTSATTRPAVRKMVEEAFPTSNAASHANATGQLHALRKRVAATSSAWSGRVRTSRVAPSSRSCSTRSARS